MSSSRHRSIGIHRQPVPERYFVLARLLQVVALLLIACAAFLSIRLWSWSPFWAVAVSLGIVFGYSATLAVQCTAIRYINRADPAPLATRLQLLRAWWQETAVAARVFFWWQPFWSSRFPDRIASGHSRQGVRGVVLVHGFLCNRGVWTHWLPALDARDVPYCAVNLEPLFGSIEDYAAILDAAVHRMEAATGLAPLIVCHSMGGLVVRAWLQARDADRRVGRIVTIGTPHRGTVIGSRLPRRAWLTNAEQMRYSSPWLVALAQQEQIDRRRKFVCYYSNCDNIVAPTSSATLPDADNRFVDGVPHLALVLEPRILRETLTLLGSEE